DVFVGKKRICGPKDLGISRQQIAMLLKYKKAKKISEIRIKEGLPFVPSFLAGFIITIFSGNWWMMLL
ncbi:MAG: hypothetical protein V1659_03945, partial [Candidatus Woesearchaeota archaeon]